MRKLLASIGVLLTLATVAHSAPVVVIKTDIGGILKDYIAAAKAYARSGTYIVVDGDCVSACTLYFSYVPKSRICATPQARLGFHWASDLKVNEDGTLDNSTKVHNPEATKRWINSFPKEMRKWVLDNHVMESDRVTYVPVAQLPFIRKCQVDNKEK